MKLSNCAGAVAEMAELRERNRSGRRRGRERGIVLGGATSLAGVVLVGRGSFVVGGGLLFCCGRAFFKSVVESNLSGSARWGPLGPAARMSRKSGFWGHREREGPCVGGGGEGKRGEESEPPAALGSWPSGLELKCSAGDVLLSLC